MWQRPMLLAAFAVTAVGQSSPLNERSVTAFLRELQRAVAQDDRAAVSRALHYPLTVWAGDIRIPLPDQAALIQHYDVVFSPALKAVIAQAATPPRRGAAIPDSVALSPDRATIGGDAIDVEPVAGALRITRISVPLSPVTVTAPAPSRPNARTVPSRRGGREPVRLLMDVGRIERAGALGAGEHDSYIVWAPRNRLLDVRVTRVNGRDVVVRIANARTHTPVDARARDGVRTWTGRLPEDADYVIDIVRLASGAARLPYGVIISLR